MKHTRIVSTGAFLPQRRVSNAELARELDTSDEWIQARTGIKVRHLVDDGQTCSDLALEAARIALRAAGLDSSDIDLIVLATSTPDQIFPSTACILQRKLGNRNAAAFDVQAVCSGFIYALSIADAMLRGGQANRALVVGSEVFSRILDWSDRSTCVLFGDGAGAVVLARDEQPGILACKLHADGNYSEILCVPGRTDHGQVVGDPFLRMDGQAVFKFAVGALADVTHEVCELAKLPLEQVDWFIPHQANVRIMQAVARRLGIGDEKMVMTVDQHANTSAASIPLALHVARSDGRVRDGHRVVLQGVGGGFTWGAVALRM